MLITRRFHNFVPLLDLKNKSCPKIGKFDLIWSNRSGIVFHICDLFQFVTEYNNRMSRSCDSGCLLMVHFASLYNNKKKKTHFSCRHLTIGFKECIFIKSNQLWIHRGVNEQREDKCNTLSSSVVSSGHEYKVVHYEFMVGCIIDWQTSGHKKEICSSKTAQVCVLSLSHPLCHSASSWNPLQMKTDIHLNMMRQGSFGLHNNHPPQKNPSLHLHSFWESRHTPTCSRTAHAWRQDLMSVEINQLAVSFKLNFKFGLVMSIEHGNVKKGENTGDR